MDAQFPDAFQFLFQKARHKIAYGGRGGGKSQSFARALLIMGAQKKLRVLCCREIQKSISDSVHALLADQIVKLELQDFYTVHASSISGKNGTTFIYAGLKHNIASLKSIENVSVAWVEEGQVVSAASWAVLLPSIRAAESEIWCSFNPLLETDPVYSMFILHPPPGALVRKVNFSENPWFPDVLRIEAEHLLATDPKLYEQVWLGAPRSSIDGAIYAAELAEAEKENRIGNVPRDRTRPVSTYWDLGFGDDTAIWFAQAMPDGTFRIIDYLENHGKTIEWYVIQLNQKGYLYGIDWLPHDGVDMIIHKKLGADPTRSIEMLMRNAGRKIRIAPKQHVSSGINAARTIFSNCWFDREKCADGLQGLRHYQWAPVTAGGVVARAPLHNFASHSADAWRTLAYGIKSPEKELPPPPPAAPSNEFSWMG